MSYLKSGGARVLTAAAVGVFLAIAPSQVRAEPIAEPKHSMTSRELRAAERCESRLERMHDRLKITSTQEGLWSKVADTMRDNAAKFRTRAPEHGQDRETTTAIDDLKSFLIISDEHSNGLKRLIPAFSTLYEGLTPEQKKRADRIFERDVGRDHI